MIGGVGRYHGPPRRVELRQHVTVDGTMRRHVEAWIVDLEKRLVYLESGAIIPFENVAFIHPLSEHDAPELAKAAPREAHACGCGKVYENPQGLGAHQRFCKGVPA